MIYFSIIELIVKENNIIKNKKLGISNFPQTNDNLNFIIEVYKILSFYFSNFYMEYLSKINIEDANFFLRDIIFNQIKTDNFFIRKNLKEELIVEKIVDTETLYTVFERC